MAPTGRDAALTCRLLHKAGIDCRPVRTVDEMCQRVEQSGAAGLLIAEEVLLASAFNRLREMLLRQDAWSDIPILLFTGERALVQANAPSTAQLLAPLGNVSLLDRPLRPITMLSAVRAALRARNRQYAARQELHDQQRAVKQRDQFLAMLGHELRNPLSAIVMATDLMEQEGADQARCSAVVRRQAGHLTRLVDDLLDVSRVTSGKIVLQLAPVDVVELLQRCLLTLDATVQKQRLGMSYTAPGRPVMVNADPVRLEQILVNLLTNATKYTPMNGRIEVSIGVDAGDAVIQVQDTGVGISAEMLPRVFDLFLQAEATLDRAKGGMGIGLTLVRSLVELHGGKVVAQSPGLGKGSTFTVRLPLHVPAQAAAPADDERAKKPAATQACDVLIVEDNADSREMLTQILARRGHRVHSACDGPSGVEQALALRPRVLLVDIGLPGLDGYGVARKVRQALGGAVFLFALTGYGQPEDRRLALEAGFDVHLTKPVDMQVISKLLSREDLHE